MSFVPRHEFVVNLKLDDKVGTGREFGIPPARGLLGICKGQHQMEEPLLG
jgi:hypothetical protein